MTSFFSGSCFSRCRASPTRRRRWKQEGAVKTRMAAKEGRRRTGGFLFFSLLRDLLMISVIYFYPIGIKTCLKLFYPRCATCKKKLGLTGFTCRCGGLFCSIHRYSDKHQCDFDYKVIISLKLVSFSVQDNYFAISPHKIVM